MSLESTVRGRRLRTVLANRDLGLLLGAGLISQIGDWILGTGIAFQVYLLTGSISASAAVLLATQIPQVVFASFAGVFVDRWDRPRVMWVVNLLLAVALLPLAVVRDAAQVWIVYLVVAMSSCLSPLFVAAEASMLPAVVEPDALLTANALNAQIRSVARLVGAALGGVIVAGGGLGALAGADIATFLLAALLIGLIRRRPDQVATPRVHLLREWTEGLVAIRRSRELTVIVVFFALSGFGEAIMGTLFAPFVHDVLGGTGRTYGAILAAQAVGGIVGGLLVTAVGHRFAPRALFGWGALVFGALDLALFLYPLGLRQVWPAMVLIALVGLPGAALSAGVLTVFQLATSDQIRGRVFGALTTAQNAAMLASTLALGAVSAWIAIVPVIVLQGAVYVLCGVVVLAALRASAGGARRVTPGRAPIVMADRASDPDGVRGHAA